MFKGFLSLSLSLSLTHTHTHNPASLCASFSHVYLYIYESYWSPAGSLFMRYMVVCCFWLQVLLDDGKTERVILAHGSGLEASQEAITEYRVLGPMINGCSWIELCPHTSRKHQVLLKLISSVVHLHLLVGEAKILLHHLSIMEIIESFASWSDWDLLSFFCSPCWV